MALIKMPIPAIVTIALVGLFLTLTITGVLGAPKRTVVSGMNVGVYSDSSCKVNCTSINWGNISPGDVVTKTIYVKNTGDDRVSLSLSTNNWSPSGAESLLELSWNLGRRYLAAGKVVPAVLTLSASSDLGSLTSFNFTIVIVGTQKRN